MVDIKLPAAGEEGAKLLTARQVAEQLAVSQRMVYDLAARRDLAAIRIGTVIRFAQADVDAFVASSRVPASVKLSSAERARPPMVRLAASDSNLLEYFRKAGVRPKPIPSSGKKPR